jgi:hypothetical protein
VREIEPHISCPNRGNTDQETSFMSRVGRLGSPPSHEDQTLPLIYYLRTSECSRKNQRGCRDVADLPTDSKVTQLQLIYFRDVSVKAFDIEPEYAQIPSSRVWEFQSPVIRELHGSDT